jgi:hypothetical protein
MLRGFGVPRAQGVDLQLHGLVGAVRRYGLRLRGAVTFGRRGAVGPRRLAVAPRPFGRAVVCDLRRAVVFRPPGGAVLPAQGGDVQAHRLVRRQPTGPGGAARCAVPIGPAAFLRKALPLA